MTSYYYSKTTKGFYTDTIHETIPNDCVSITEDDWIKLIEGQCSGKEIVSDENGFPVLADRKQEKIPELTPEEKLARAGLTVEELKTLLGL